jgi:GT2 family glycosyltransferase
MTPTRAEEAPAAPSMNSELSGDAPLPGAASVDAGITLAVPYYSNPALLDRTLRTIEQQTHPTCHVLVCDDSAKGLASHQVNDLRRVLGDKFPVRVLRNEQNLGMAATWNRCLEEAQTDLVTLVHGDDELEPNYAQEMVRLAGAHPHACAVFCGARIISASGEAIFSFPDFYKNFLIPRHKATLVLSGERAVNSLLRGNYIFCPSLCFRRSELRSHRFDARYRMVLDIDLVTRLLLDERTIVGVPKRPLYRYRRHENATHHLTRELTRFSEEASFYAELAPKLAAAGYATAAATARKQRYIKMNLAYCILRDLLQRNFADSYRKAALLGSFLLQRAKPTK